MDIMKFAIILILLGFGLFAGSLSNEFIWDDEEQIVNNTHIHSLKNTLSFFAGSTFHTGGAGGLSGLYYKPLMTLTYSSLYTVAGPEPFFFHLFQLILHIFNALMLMLVLYYLLKSISKDIWATVTSFLISLIFLIHPLNVETVAYIAALQDTLFFFFGIAALLLLVTPGQRTPWWLRMTGVGTLLLLSILSKESGALFFGLTGIYTLIFLRHRLFSYIVTAGLSSIVYVYLRFFVAEVFFNKHGMSPINMASLPERLLSVPRILWHYFRYFFWPDDLAIAQHWMVQSFTWSNFFLPLLLITTLVIALVSWGITLYKKRDETLPLWLFFTGWLLLGLALHLQLFPLDMTVADRWFYFPMVGLLGLLALAIRQLRIPLWPLSIALLIITIALSARTVIRTQDWQDGYTLYSHDIAISPDSFDLQNNLGVELYRHQKPQEAKKHFQKSVDLAPHWWTNWNNLGVLIEADKDYETALKYYQKSIDNGGYHLAYGNKARLLANHNPAAAEAFLRQAVEQFPYNAELWMYRAVANYHLERYQPALEYAQKAHMLAPSPATSQLITALRQTSTK